MPDTPYHDPNRHDSMTVILAAVVALVLGSLIGVVATYYAIT
jgi:hypothetical protein